MTARAPDARARSSVTAFLPVALAIAVFGTLYGAAARPLLGQWTTLLSSVLIFSGTVQFTMVGLLTAGSGPLAVLWAVVVVNVRNLALGGAVRPLLRATLFRRLVTSWFLIDETVGLALASPASPDRTLLRSGLLAYAAWVAGTAIGVAGGAVLGLEALAEAVFPVLFIGLAALMVHTVGGGIRALAGAAALSCCCSSGPGWKVSLR